MTSGDAEGQYDPAHADRWDATADERQRLADEREQLASERENLADERERLADLHERLADQRYATMADQPSADAALDEEEQLRVEAIGQLARADLRLQRAIAERERARMAVERSDLGANRHTADSERVARRHDADDDEWEVERRGFVAGERERLANVRDDAQDLRDELADLREREADQRDHAARERDHDLDALEHRHLMGGGERATRSETRETEVVEARAVADRQRQSAARVRRRAGAERAEARRTAAGSSIVPDTQGPRLTAEFVDLTRELFASRALSDVVDRVLDFAVDSLPIVAAGVVISGGGITTLRVASDSVAEHLDGLQIDEGSGPTVEALHASEPVLADTFASWPRLEAAGDTLGVTAALAYGLSVRRDERWHAVGVLTLYAERASALDHDTRDVCSIFASYLAVAAGLERDRNDVTRREAALHRALGTRDVIGQAKGILMERQHLSAGAAFDILRATSQRLNLRLHEVAARLAETGDLPD